MGAATAFWVLRVHYWSITHEVPFSDMFDFEAIALRVLDRGDFGHGDFWLSYRPPMLPLVRAGVMAMIGRDQDLVGWRWVLAMLTFSTLCWLCFEVFFLTRRAWLAFGIMAMVALSKSSIFWSLKIASEGLAEAAVYLAIAATLLAERLGQRWPYVLTGFSYAVALLTRPVYVVIAAVVAPLLLLRELVRRRQTRGPFTRALVIPALVYLGIALGWAPWLGRSLWLYGHVVPLTTQGPYSTMWEYGTFTVTIDGQPVTTNTFQLQADAPKNFRNDYESSQYAGRVLSAWVRANWVDLLKRILNRIPQVVLDRSEALSQVPRETLFPGSRLERLLFDKSLFVVVTGVLGMLLLSWRFRPLTIVPVICLGSWALSVVALGLGRMIEPVLPMLLAGNLGWLLVPGLVLAKFRGRSNASAATSSA
ncbi:MAG: hypothetical protein IPJ65_43195 [Archangiaceae bacterium]|nr:hypothetical protein [Archangiaceae bacterium]